MKTTTANRTTPRPPDPAVAAERQRTRDLMALGRERNVDASLVNAMIDAGTSVDAARRSIVVGDNREAFRPFATFGEQLKAVREAANGFGTDPRLKLVAGTPSGLNESVGSEGGFLVQTDFAEQILERAWNYGQILRRVRRYPVPADRPSVTLNAFDETSRADGQRLGGVQGFWLSEADQFTSSRAKIRQLKLQMQKLITLCYLTSELDTDSPAASQAALDGFAQEISFLAEDKIVNGKGAGTPLGILNSPALITQALEATQTIANSAQFIGLNVVKMFTRLFASRDPSAAAWLVNAELLQTLFQAVMPNTGGTPIAEELFDFDGEGSIGYGTLLGRPVIPAEYCQAVGTPGDIILTDLAEYLLGDKEPGQLRSIHIKFLTDEVAYRVVYRCDGQPLWTKPVTPKNGSNTVSPYVTLAARS